MANVGYATLQVIPSFQGVQEALTSGVAGPSAAAGTAAGLGFGAKFAAALASPAGIIAAAAGAATAAGKALYDIGEQFDEAYDTIRVGTGATGTELEKLKGVFKGVVSDVPTDFGAASAAVADLNTRLGITGQPLRLLAGDFLELSRITGTDVSENIKSVTRLFGDWGVESENQRGTLDQLFRASQATGIGVNELAQGVVFYGSALRQLGFPLDESIALFAKWHQEGVNVETVLGGLRQGLGRLTAPTDQFLGKLREFPGLEEAFGAQPTVAGRFQVIKDKILELFATGDQADRLKAGELALEAFGRRAGADVVAAFGEGRFAVEDLMDAIVNGSDTVRKAGEDTQDFAEKWQMLKNRVLVALEPIAIRVFDAVGKAMDAVAPHIESLLQGASDLLSGHGELAKKLGPIWETIKSAISSVVDFVRELWSQWGDDIVSFVETYFGAFVDKLEAAFAVVKGVFDVFAGILSGDWSRVWDGIKRIVGGVWDTIVATIRQGWAAVVLVFRTIGERLLSAGKSIFTGLWDGMKAVWSFIEEWVIGLPGKILGWLLPLAGQLLTFGRQAFQALWSGMLNVWTAVSSWLLSLPGTILSFLASLPGLMLGLGQNAVRALWDGFAALIGWLGGQLAGFVDRTIFVLGAIIEGAYNVGKNIVEGIWNGIKGAAGWLWDKISGWVSGLWRDIKGLLGISSPSKLFATVGRDMVLGVGKGWDDHAGGVARRIERSFTGLTIEPIEPIEAADVSRGGVGTGGRDGVHFHGPVTFGDRAVLDDLDYFWRTRRAVA